MALDPTKLSEEQLAQLVASLEKREQIKATHKLYEYRPFEKQREFHALGSQFRLRAFFANNQGGKTYAGAAEMVMHLTGDYPEDWQGKRFDHPIRAWACGDTSETVRGSIQTLIMGPFADETAWGTGLLPRWSIKSWSMNRGISNAIDTVVIEHRNGGRVDGNSILSFKSYEQGREKFQAATLDIFWIDEEPGEEIYDELLARISSVPGGCGYLTLTPMKGRTALVKKFLEEQSSDRAKVTMTIWEGNQGQTLPREQVQKIIDGWPSYIRQARAYGVPVQGEGLVFEVAPESLVVAPFDPPLHWAKIWGIDFGIAHPFAAVLLAWDRDTDTVYLLDSFRVQGETPFHHVPRILARAGDVPVAYPHDGDTREKSTGTSLITPYRKLGLNVLGHFASHPGFGRSLEASVLDLSARMLTGRFRIFPQNTEFMQEMRNYHRKDGIIVPLDDDLISAVRYGIMCLSKAQPVPLGRSMGRGITMGQVSQQPGGKARNVEFPLF